MTRTRRLSVVLILNLMLVAGLLVVGVSANSLGVLAEGADYLADAAAAAAGVAVAGIYVTKGLYWLDPVVAAIIAVVVGYHAVHVLIEIFQALRAHRRSVSRP
ncbi:hypothetical protein ACSVHC_15000 [Arthrobacter sp. KNU-44]|uniref:hypothetical protein n=1 Tax=unclassified Arthrobacter TaxID=235627 RepID=UPI003F435CE6